MDKEIHSVRRPEECRDLRDEKLDCLGCMIEMIIAADQESMLEAASLH